MTEKPAGPAQGPAARAGGGSRASAASPLRRLFHRMRSVLARVQPGSQTVVWNAGGARGRHRTGRALLVYLPRAFRLRENSAAFVRHSNLRRCRTMVAVLDELGYVVDVANRRDDSFRPRRDYDLVISEKFDWGVDRARFGAQTRHAFLATSMSHALHNVNLRRRHERLAERGRPPVVSRRIYRERLPALDASNALIAIGNAFTAGTWRGAFAGPIHAFDNTAVHGGAVVPGPRRLETARRHFLFLASGTQIQKGLDLLLEIFPRHPDLHLWVCSGFETEPEFVAAYRRELYETPNVHAVGWVSLAGPEFTALLERCAFVVLPSCSEGQAGSVIHPLHSGLIPLVTRESGVDTAEHGITFAGDSIAEIERVIVDVSRRPPESLAEMAAGARRVAQTRYTEDAFTRRWRAIVEEITRSAR